MSETVDLEQPHVDVTDNETRYPVLVPIVTSFITIIIVFVVIIVILRFKCFNHTVGTFCFKEDVENKSDEDIEDYRYIIKYGKDGGTQRSNGNFQYLLSYSYKMTKFLKSTGQIC